MTFAMFRTLFTLYPIRESLLGSLSAIDVARLLRALGEENVISGRDRARYLNPMRDLFNDKDLLEMQQDLATMVDHHIVFWGFDLMEFLLGVPENLGRPNGKKLDLWVTQVSTQPADWLANQDPELGSDEPWFEPDTALWMSRRPKIIWPGEWMAQEVHPCYGGAKQIMTSLYEHMNNVRLHVLLADEVAHSPDEYFWKANLWQTDIPVVKIPNDLRTTAASDFMPAGQQLHYMTTKDMKTFHIKTVQNVASPTQLANLHVSRDRDLVLLYNFIYDVNQPDRPLRIPDLEWRKFIFSLQDDSPDEHSTGSLDLS
jgi:hypothetical protein